KPDLDKRLLMTASVDLDALLNTYTSLLAQGGKNLLTNPFRMPITLTNLIFIDIISLCCGGCLKA
ncbi:MAG: hypothetical protein KKC39_05855, partial [Candidatus Omnitrophica bacterium]|nr:hypothetical protein [Candidatus Omnitrophota bacterium]